MNSAFLNEGTGNESPQELENTHAPKSGTGDHERQFQQRTTPEVCKVGAGGQVFQKQMVHPLHYSAFEETSGYVTLFSACMIMQSGAKAFFTGTRFLFMKRYIY